MPDDCHTPIMPTRLPGMLNPRTQTLGKPTTSQTLGENHPIFGKLKIHTCNQVLFKVQKYTKNIAPWFLFPLSALLDARSGLHEPDLPSKNGVAIRRSSQTPRSMCQTCRVK